MCFTTDKLRPLNLQGNVFGGSKLTRPLMIQDYIHILMNHDKHMDSDLAKMINTIQAITSRYRHFNDTDNLQRNISGRVKVRNFKL